MSDKIETFRLGYVYKMLKNKFPDVIGHKEEEYEGTIKELKRQIRELKKHNLELQQENKILKLLKNG